MPASFVVQEPNDYAVSRREMVERQLRRIRDPRVLRAMLRVPRHLFVPPILRHVAYQDQPLPIGDGQTISQPLMVAIMLEAAELSGEERVLEVGAGSGYQAALLAELCREVYAVEIIPELAATARDNLAQAGVRNVQVITGDGSLGLAAHAPYDAILVAAGAPSVPHALLEQLAVGGRLIIPVGPGIHQTLQRLRRTSAGVTREDLDFCAFVPLVGAHE